jgi:TolB-like protein
MEAVKPAGLLFFSFILLLFGCNSIPITEDFSQAVAYEEMQNLDNCILNGTQYLISRMPDNSKIAVVNIESQNKNVSNYVIDTICMYLTNEDKFIVIERSDIAIIQNEQHFQSSGFVSDETAVSIGKQIGTQYIISGSILPLGQKYSLKLKVTNIETAQIIGAKIYQVKIDDTLIALIETQTNETVVQEEETELKNVINGDINIINNNTTTIQGDVYVNMPNGLNW